MDEALFLYFPRPEMMDFLETYYNDPELLAELEDAEILEIGTIRKIDGKYYSILDYKLTIQFLLRPGMDETEEEFQQRSLETKLSFEEMFSLDQIAYVEDLNLFRQVSHERAIAIYKFESCTWKFLVYDEEELLVLGKLIPDVLMQELNQHLGN